MTLAVSTLLIAAVLQLALLVTAQPSAVVSSHVASQHAPAIEPNSVAMCLVVKNQNDDIREWIQHHQQLGVSKFYVWDNNSSVPMLQQLYDLVESGVVDYRYFLEFEHPSRFAQSWVYDQCLQRYGGDHRWIAFMDADEFLVLKPGYTQLPDLLREYEDYGGLAINWIMFGSSGHVTRPKGSTLTAYSKCLPKDNKNNLHVKVIANTKYATSVGASPHGFLYRDSKFAVDVLLNRVDGPFTKAVRTDKVVIHHYVLKSLEEFRGKMLRGAAHGHLSKDMSFFQKVDEQATVDCREAGSVAA
ncbi:hypothetical protein WJX72_006976 [[Myrmecia] bisecta]|uniref:Glycosyltransferase family 92 protein n=1 Tax=[Myrmecia] bisecta TaxID=41462 RepID=A0AAW1P1T7_9CHLO